jgi:hypothetical protein
MTQGKEERTEAVAVTVVVAVVADEVVVVGREEKEKITEKSSAR